MPPLPEVSLIAIRIVSNVLEEHYYNGKTCQTIVATNFNNLTLTHPEWFGPTSTPNNPFLTVQGCMAICGPEWGDYPDFGQRIFEWILPGLLLLTSQHFPAIGATKYLMLAHVIGDPAGSMFSLLSTIEDWVDSSQKAQGICSELFSDEDMTQYKIKPKMIATIIAAVARLLPSLDDFASKLYQSLDITDTEQLKARCDALRKAATALRNQRLHDTRRTTIAVSLYIFGIIAIFVTAIGGSANPSGGKVSPAMMLIWLLSLILLSNMAGDYACWTDSQDTLQKFLSAVNISASDSPETNSEIADRSIWTHCFTELACSGAIIQRRSLNRRQASFIVISVLPVILSCFTALVVDDTGPTWFSCRGLYIVVSLLSWLVSFAATAFMRRWIHSRYLWLYIFMKDVVVGVPILVILVLATCGFFNSCKCVSGELFRGVHAMVILNSVPYWDRCGLTYKVAVGTGIVLQILLLVFVRYFFQREGFKTMWWRDASVQPRAKKAEELDEGRGRVLPLPETSIAASLKGKATFQIVEIELNEIDLGVHHERSRVRY